MYLTTFHSKLSKKDLNRLIIDGMNIELVMGNDTSTMQNIIF